MRMLLRAVVALVVLAAIHSGVHAYKSYSKYQLWRLHPTTDEQVAKLLDFSRVAHEHKVNFWSEEFRKDLPVEFLRPLATSTR